MNLKTALIVTGIVTGLVSCATMSTPDGGPKDLAPPILIESNPEDQQLNVNTKTIQLVFDEEVQQKNLTKELLITPNINNKYQVKSNRNVMTLEFEDQLQDSTTFTFNFREGIVDITEQNKAQNLKIAFSTGSFIDSSSVSGRVVDLLKQTPEKGAVVALYQAEDTLSIRKNRPYYLTTTDDAGNYEIENIKEGNYRVYALIDKNNNTYYDTEEEKIAYLPAPIRIMPGTDSINLQTVRFDTKKPILLQRERYTDRFIANYNEGIQSFTARPVAAGTDSLVHRIGTVGKAVEVFKTPEFDGGQTVLTAVDSSGNIAVDTIAIAFEGKRAQRVRGAQLKVINGSPKSGYRAGQLVTLEVETPIRITGDTPVTLQSDSTVLHQITPEQITIDRTKTELSFTLPAVDDRIKQLSVVLDSTAIVPITGDTLIFQPLNITIAEARGTATFSGTAATDYTSFIIQLLNSEYKVVEEVRDNKSFRFRNIEPGTYRLRVLVDENNNGIWEKGDPNFETAPEKVYVLPEVLEIRAGWERDEPNFLVF
ncbi:Ig-like domain-containing domain [Pontibacter pamirensis]|uniref:Ig-like domain-containing domain n=1 Tax=Pontibacter pamirensis TaxID=2562824 RepID=UPI001389FF66|nr:Ig-like domain-containing domain [Pontibacter pamirensis]